MKILLGDEELEIIQAGTNRVVFDSADVDEEEEEEDVTSSASLPSLIYKVKLYKNAQAQQPDKTVRVEAVNLSVQALSDTNAVLVLVNNKGQAVYMVAWELVHSVDSEPAPQ